MCGIVGIAGRPGAPAWVAEGLAKLEYRGYDSAGLAWAGAEGLVRLRTTGRVAELLRLLPPDAAARAALGHTRWATHGPPSEKNAHPHLSHDGRIAVAHNGIIENSRELRAELEAMGISFASDTDTEAVAHLVALAYANGPARGDLPGSVALVLPRLEGSFAFGFLAADQPGMLVGARRGSPLAVAFFEGACAMASDALPLLPLSRKVTYLEDDQMAIGDSRGWAILGDGGAAVSPEPVEVGWSPGETTLSGHAHYMHKEIHEQPAMLARVARERLRLPPHGPPQIDVGGAYLPPEAARRVERIVLVAQGTAHHAAMIARNMLERTCRLPVYAEYAADFRYRDPVLDPSVLVLAVTQSGETMDTLGAIRVAREAGCRVISFVNAIGSTAARESDGIFDLGAGPEVGVASTKAFTSMLLGLYLFSLRLGLDRGALDDGEARRRARDALGVAQRVEAALTLEPLMERIAQSCKDARIFLFLGRGTGWPLALEGALKLKEVSYIHAEGYDAAEMKHGPIALVEEGSPALFIALGGRRYPKILGNIQEVKARGGRIIALADHDDRHIGDLAHDVIPVRADAGIMNSIICAAPLQLLAYHMAAARGCDIDKPRNLAKSVTVE